MKYEALVSFVGAICMAKGEVREIPDSPIVKSLIDAGYIKAVQEKKTRRKKVEE